MQVLLPSSQSPRHALDLSRILDSRRARKVWEEMRHRKPGRGRGGGYGMSDLDGRFDADWADLHRRAECGVFSPGVVRWFSREKRSGGVRWIAWLPALERVLHRVLADTLKEPAEALFSDRSFAYRPGRTAGHAAWRLARELHPRGVLVRADIEDCYGSIPRRQTVDAVSGLGTEEGLLSLLSAIILRAPSEPGRPPRPGRGLAQGSPLSPLLCNLVLHSFDSAMEAQECRFVRYADDIAMPARSHAEGLHLLDAAAASLRPLGMKFNPRKCAVLPPAETEYLGFAFRRDAAEGGWALAVSPESGERIVRRAEEWCAPGAKVDFRQTVQRVGQLYSEWFSFHQTTGDRAGLQHVASRLRDVLRREHWSRLGSPERREAFLIRRGLAPVAARQAAGQILPAAALRRAMPRERFTPCGLDGSFLLPRSSHTLLGYDGSPQ